VIAAIRKRRSRHDVLAGFVAPFPLADDAMAKGGRVPGESFQRFPSHNNSAIQNIGNSRTEGGEVDPEPARSVPAGADRGSYMSKALRLLDESDRICEYSAKPVGRFNEINSLRWLSAWVARNRPIVAEMYS
jgi:hypothetical protein